MLTPREYYRNQNVIERLIQYCGGKAGCFKLEPNFQNLSESPSLKSAAASMTSEYLVGWGKRIRDEHGREYESVRNTSLGWLLDNGFDVFRSVWEKKGMLFVIDVEYYSRKYPQLPYVDQEYTFNHLEFYYHLIKKNLQEFGINPFILTTGQGYHYVFRVDSGSPAFQGLVEIGHLEDSLRGKYNHLGPDTKRERIVSDEEGKAYDAVGKLLEFLYHRLIREMKKYNPDIPLLIGDIAVGNPNMEAVSFDLSGYANPIFMRDIRLAFSTHQKHKLQSQKLGEEVSRSVPVQISIPRYIPGQRELELEELFRCRRHYENAALLAGTLSCAIPDAGAGVLNLLRAYKGSELYAFHQDFDRTKQDPPGKWFETYDRVDLSRLPPCVAHAVAHPNPLLLQPTHLQTLVRTMCGKQWWHPKHVAGLIRSKYERNYNWEIDFHKYDANTWASVWTRIYSGLLADHTDELIDFNCISHQEKGASWGTTNFCVKPGCGNSLLNYK